MIFFLYILWAVWGLITLVSSISFILMFIDMALFHESINDMITKIYNCKIQGNDWNKNYYEILPVPPLEYIKDVSILVFLPIFNLLLYTLYTTWFYPIYHS